MEREDNLERLSLYVDGELQGEERLETAEDLYASNTLRDDWIAFERGKAALNAAPHAMPERLRERLARAARSRWSGPFASPADSARFALPKAAWVFATASVLLAAAVHWNPLARVPKTIPLARLLAEHAQSARKSSDIGRAILHAAPYDSFERTETLP